MSFRVFCGLVLLLAGSVVAAQEFPTFTAPNGDIWLHPFALNSQNYFEQQWTLANSDFRLATKEEVQSLIGPDGGPTDIVLAFLASKGIARSCKSMSELTYGVKGIYDDSLTGFTSPNLGLGSVLANRNVSINDDIVPPNYFAYGNNPSDTSIETCTGIWAIKKPPIICGSIGLTKDFNCDGLSDSIVWRPSSGRWYIQRRGINDILTFHWGLNGDIPFVGDVTGDLVPELIVWRPETGSWYIRNLVSASQPYKVIQWGLRGDIPRLQNSDADGILDLVVFRPTTGTHYFFSITRGYLRSTEWGLLGDIVPGN
ncbi:MAG: hypothetical protein KDB03_04990 [Planctomycetales bacterium]|nr:hypothetical protein [Planctomycetales bacterium]